MTIQQIAYTFLCAVPSLLLLLVILLAVSGVKERTTSGHDE